MSQELRLSIDLADAVERGVIAEDQAIALRNLEAEHQGLPLGSEEALGKTSMHDLYMAALTVLVGLAIAGIANWNEWALPVGLGALWLLAERVRLHPRMPVTKGMLFLVFIFEATAPLREHLEVGPNTERLIGATIAAGAALWWVRFRLPFLLAIALIPVVLLFAGWMQRLPLTAFEEVFCNLGLAVTILVGATLWDITDIRRETVRTRYAWWMHLVAACTVGLAFIPLLQEQADANLLLAAFTLAIGMISLFVAVALERRIWILAALFVLSSTQSALTASAMVAVSAFAVGSVIWWHPLRKAVVTRLPLWLQAQLPRTDLHRAGVRPTRRHLAWRPRKLAAIRRLEGFSSLTGSAATQD